MAQELGLFFRPGYPDDFSDPTEKPADVCRKLAASRLRVGWLISRGDDARHAGQMMSDAEELLTAAEAADRGEDLNLTPGWSELIGHAEALVDALNYDDGWIYGGRDFAALQEFARGIVHGIQELEHQSNGCPPLSQVDDDEQGDKIEAQTKPALSPAEIERVFGIDAVRELYASLCHNQDGVANHLMLYLEQTDGVSLGSDDFEDRAEERQRFDGEKPLGFYDACGFARNAQA